MATLPDMLRAEMTRCQSLAQDYAALGSTGAFACALLEEALREAQVVLRSGDVRTIQCGLDRLRSFREVMPNVAAGASHPPATGSATVAASAQNAVSRSARFASAASPWGRGHQFVPEQFFTWTRKVA